MIKYLLISASLVTLTCVPANAQWNRDDSGRGDDYRRGGNIIIIPGGGRDDYRPNRRGDDDYRPHRRGDDDYRPNRRGDDDDYRPRPSRYPDRDRYRDSDHDGIPDYRDRSPYGDRTETRPNRYPDRLPDRDHDGVPDYRDRTDNRYPDRRPDTRPLPRPDRSPEQTKNYPDRDPPRPTNTDRDDWKDKPQSAEKNQNKGGDDSWKDKNKSGSAKEDWDNKKDTTGCSGYGCGTMQNPR